MTDTAGSMCSSEATGPEFNPLTERNKYGQLNPFQDPTRGRIDSCILDSIVSPDPNVLMTRGCNIGKSAEDGQEFLL